MKPTIQQAVTKAAIALFIAGSAHAATLLTSEFTGAISGDTNTLDISWSGLEAGGASDLTAVYPSGGAGFARPGNAFGSNGDAFINTNLNVSPTTDLRGFSFTLTPASDYDLGELEVQVAHANSAGAAQVFESDLNLIIEDGGGTVFSETKTGIIYQGIYQKQTFGLTGISLSAATTYTVTVGMNNLDGGGAYFAADSLTLTAIPEPSVIALVGFGSFCLLRRRR